MLSEASLGLAWVEDILSERERFDMGFCVKCLCACIVGEDLAASLPRYRPSIALARGTNGNIRQAIDDRRERLMWTKEPAIVKRLCRGIIRKIIRTGFTLVMPRYGGWTSELDPCVEVFGLYYPEQRAAMNVALTLARAPSADRAQVLAILDSLGAWLVQEYDRVILTIA